MALRQLILSKKIEQRKQALEELLRNEEVLKTRNEQLETALEEAKTDEEIAVVDEEINKLEEDQTEFEEKKGALEGEIAQLEGELEQINSKEPTNEKRDNLNGITMEGETRMRTRTIFKSMTREAVDTLLQREEVKQFLGETRAIIGEKRAVTGADLTIPEVMLDLMKDNLHRYSKLITKVRLKTVSGKARQNVAGTIPEGIWTEAIATLNELSIEFNQVEVDAYMVGGFIAIPNSYLEDSDYDLAAEILDALSQAIGLAVDKAIVYGTGIKMPFGIMSRLAQSVKPSNWPINAPEWVDLHTINILKFDGAALTGTSFFETLILKLGAAKSNYSMSEKIWCMNNTTKTTVLAKSLAFNAAGAVVAGMSNQMPVIGGEIIELPFIPDGDMIGGYPDLYLLAERKGSNFEKSEHFRFIQNQTIFKGTARYDGMPVIASGFVAVNINNMTPTTVVTFAGDKANPEDAYLHSLAIGSLNLSPAFRGAVENYTVETTNATNTVAATAAKTGATVTIKVNNVSKESGDSVTWNTGENTAEVTVKYGTTTKVYTVLVIKS